jgi:hypothetical protein
MRDAKVGGRVVVAGPKAPEVAQCPAVVGRSVFASGGQWTARSVGSTATSKGRGGKIALDGTSLGFRSKSHVLLKQIKALDGVDQI